MDKIKFPHVPKDLIEMLEQRFPDRAPDMEDGLDKIRFRSGQVSVVRLLRYQFDLQNQNLLEN